MRRSEIEFQAGSILRKEMLQDMYDYPRIAVESLYSDYSDGILYGLVWKEIDNDHHVICPGALKFHGKIYFLREELNVEDEIMEELKVNDAYRLCFVCQTVDKEIESKTDYYLKLSALKPEAYKEVKEDAYWYAYIRYSGLGNIEIITGGAAISYGIAGLMASDDGFEFQLPNWLIKQQLLGILERKNDKHPLDYQLLREIYEGKPISLSFINVYLNELEREKLDANCEPAEALEILKESIEKLVLRISVKPEGEPEVPKKTSEFRGGSL